MTIDICVTHFGHKYSTRYLDNLERGIGRNYSGDFNFVVKTDCPNRHWDKISFFDCDKRTIVMDIDMIVMNNLNELFKYPVDGFGAFQRWWRGNQDINGGFYILEPSEQNHLLKESFYQDPESWIYRYSNIVGTKWMGEQTFVNDHILDKTVLPGQWLGIYVDRVEHKGVYQKQADFNRMYNNLYNTHMINTCKFMHFIYDQRIEQHDKWIIDLWNGTSYV